MLKKTVTYTDYNGVQRTEDFYFNLSKAELMEMELGTTGGFAEKMQAIVASNDGPTIMRVFKEILLKAYGEKSDDGKRFVKSPEISAAFEQTEAYSQIFMELVTDADKSSEFIIAIMPKDIQEDAQKEAKKLAAADKGMSVVE